MGWKIWQQNEKNAVFREAFEILTSTLLSLLLPLSFLLLARLTAARYLLDLNFLNPTSPHFTLLFSIFLYTNPTLLHGLVSIVSVSSFVNILSRAHVFYPSSQSPGPAEHSRIYTAWIFLCTLQIFVGLGIEGSIGSGVDSSSSNFGYDRSLLTRVIFFVGLHETMLHWCRTVVKPVVDDTVFGCVREERWVERMFMAASFSGLWWWILKDEVETLVVAAEVKREMLTGVGVADFVGWWLYYLTVTIGMVRLVKGLVWVGMILLSRKVEGIETDSCGNDEKV